MRGTNRVNRGRAPTAQECPYHSSARLLTVRKSCRGVSVDLGSPIQKKNATAVKKVKAGRAAKNCSRALFTQVLGAVVPKLQFATKTTTQRCPSGLSRATICLPMPLEPTRRAMQNPQSRTSVGNGRGDVPAQSAHPTREPSSC